jgi:hypothetical protein
VAVVHGNPPGLTEIGNLHVTQLDLDAFGSGFATREKCDIMQHTFALIAEARCPNGGNLQIATQLFTTRVASASPVMSSAIISIGLPLFVICSSSGSRSFLELIVPSWART